MILFEAPVFSLTREVTVFAIFVGVVIAIIVIVDLMYGPNPPIQKADVQDLEIFDKVEEYRNDFPDAS